jgi:uncharacterized protein (TIGR02145 family)
MKRIMPLLLLVCITAGISIMVSCKKDPVIPTLTTTAITDITANSVTSGGLISKDGGAGITARGVCWGTTSKPDVSGSHTTDGTGTGSFVSNLTGLTSGVIYYVRAYATNKAGTAYGNEIIFTTVLLAPTDVVATAGNAQATVAFTAPVGVSTITGYTVTSTPGGITATGTASPITVTGLTNGTAYTFTIIAANESGNSPASPASNSVIPSTSPGAPTIGTATAGNAQATVAFTAPANNGGSAITGYTVSSNPGNITGSGTTSPIIVTGLTNGTAYTFTVIATNAAGNSPASVASNSVIPSTGPGAPTIGTATAGNGQAIVAFTAPTNTGGSPITGYTVTSNPGNITVNGSTSPITVTGLTNGTAYTFTVVAKNANGTSSASSASNSVTPATVPGAPTIGTAAKGNAQAIVTFTPPSITGGSPITGYIVTSNPGNITINGSASPITVTGLTNGTTYTFTVVATNAIGSSSQSAASNAVTPSSVPGAPTIGTATKGNAQANVAFTAPSNTGGSPITGYTVTSNPGNIIVNGSTSPITVTGLTNGTTYTFTVTATNANGISLPSSASNSVIPSTVPGAPAIGTATEGDAQVSVTFTAPASNGGSVITGYTVTSNPGNISITGGTSPITVTGLTNGTLYTFTVVANNINGSSIASAASNSVRPHTATTIYDIEGNVYNIVTIGSQVWMANNLKTATFANGEAIPTTADLTTDISGMTSPVFQWPDNSPAMVDISAVYGRLYTWYAAIDSRNVCPAGWHVPSDADFGTLSAYLGGDLTAGGALKEVGITHWSAPNTTATNTTGFTMIGSGDRLATGGLGAFVNTYDRGYLWSSSINGTLSWGRTFDTNDAVFLRNGYLPRAGVSIRCLKNP